MAAQDSSSSIESLTRVLRILWVALFATPVAMLAPAILGIPFPSDFEPEQRLPISAGFGVASLLFTAISFLLPPRVRAQNAATPAKAVTISVILAMALCEAGGLVAVAGYTVTRFHPVLLGLLVSSMAMIVHLPQRERHKAWLKELAR